MAIEAQSPSGPAVVGSTGLRSASARDRLAGVFPDPSAPKASWWRRRRRVLIGVLAVALVASILLAAEAFGAENPTYRTAIVAVHDVDAQLTGVAAVEPVAQASVAFPGSGTVTSVDVKLGDAVTVGQPLASLDPTSLNQALHTKQAALTQAQLVLEKALNGESVAGVGGSSSGAGGSRTPSSSTITPTAALRGATTSSPVQLTAASIPSLSNGSIASAQQAVLAAQQKVDAALNTANQAVDSAATVCAAAGIGTGASNPTPTSEELTACQTATKEVVTAQAAVSAAQTELAAASTALDTLLEREAAAAATSPSSSGTSSGTTRGAAGTGQTAAAASPSAADLVAYQKAVDAAESDVAVAVQAIAQATIVSPITGTVEAVKLAVGDAVTAGSSTANIVVVGPGGYEVTTTVSVDKITDVKVGQPATYLPDGGKRPLTGTVASISIAPDAKATTTSYRVVVGLTDPNVKLDNGSTGSLTIVTKSSRSALAVPTSAITTIGTRHTVTVLEGTTATRTLVQVGVIGDTWTEITGGVRAGRQVVLADLGEPLPGSATDSSSSGANQPGAGGRFPIGGLPGSFPVGGRGG
ncbi:MAG: HlyD family efflux transporter periplasmic adaptor subunit [Acidimicrobiia bacterium]